MSAVFLDLGSRTHPAMDLGPEVVHPGFRQKGIGGALGHEGLEFPAKEGHGIVVPVGHQEYYPQFDFGPRSRHGHRWEQGVPDEASMIRRSLPGALAEVEGTVRFRTEFDQKGGE